MMSRAWDQREASEGQGHKVDECYWRHLAEHGAGMESLGCGFECRTGREISFQ